MSASLAVIAAGEPARGAPDVSAEATNRDLRAATREMVRPVWDDTFDQMLDCVAIGEPTDSDRKRAIRDLEESLRPAPARIVLSALTELRLRTAARPIEQNELSMTMGLYTNELTPFPIDIVRTICRGRWRFWPPLIDLLDAAEKLRKPRQLILEALRQPRQPRQPREEWPARRSQHDLDHATLSFARVGPLAERRIEELRATLARFEPQDDLDHKVLAQVRSRLEAHGVSDP